MFPKIFSPRPVKPLKRRLFDDHGEASSSKRLCLPSLLPLNTQTNLRSESCPISTDRETESVHPLSRYKDEIMPRACSAPSGFRKTLSPPPPPIVSSTPRPRPDTSSTNDSCPSSSRFTFPAYRESLQRNGIVIQPHRSQLSRAVQDYAFQIINTTRDSPELSEDDVDRINDQLHAVKDEGENTIKSGYIAAHMFPMAYNPSIKIGSSVPFNVAGPPDLPNASLLSMPKPDLHYCFNNLLFSNDEYEKMSLSTLYKYAKPSPTGSWPFFTVEFKSEAERGTLWTAENQNAESGALCVNIMEKLLSLTDMQRSETDSIAFSCNVHASQASIWVHYRSQTTTKFTSCAVDHYWMDKNDDIVRFRNGINGILEFGLHTRLPQIKDALAKIAPSDLDWRVWDEL